MGKIFAIEDGATYVEVDGKWHRCTVDATSVSVLEAVKISPKVRFNLAEVRAKCASLPKRERKPK